MTQTDPNVSADAPVRYCHGCRQYDTAPRAVHVVDIHRPDLDTLYHYDCAPVAVVSDEKLAPIMDAVKDGIKDDDLREVAVEHAATIEEDPAHPLEEQPAYLELHALAEQHGVTITKGT